MDMQTAVFLVILVFAVWQDIRVKSLGRGFLLLSGSAGVILTAAAGRDLKMTGLSLTVGGLVRILSYVTGGEIGEGDGWFFIVTGFFLKPAENALLFLSGLTVCSVYGLILTVKVFVSGGSIRRRRIPFLPCLLPAGIWLALA